MMNDGQLHGDNHPRQDDYFTDYQFCEDENLPEFPNFADLFRMKTEFDTRKELVDWVMSVGKQNNMYFAIQSSRKANTKRKGNIIIGCERSGRYRYNFRSISKIFKPRENTKTRKNKCPFKLTGNERNGGTWKLKVVSKYTWHNHELGVYHQWHSSVAKLTEEEIVLIKHLRKANVKTKQILTQLKIQNPLNVSGKKHIDNALQKIKRQQMGQYSPIQFFFKSLKDKKYLVWYDEDEDSNTLGNVLFAHPKATDLLHLFPHVVLMDATYRTNKFNLPLLEIIGVSPTGQNFHVAFGFLKNEKYESYLWAMQKVQVLFGRDNSPGVIVTDRELALMNAAKYVFPNASHLLCKRHIAKDVEKYVTNITKNKDLAATFSIRWGKIVNSITEDEYNKAIDDMVEAWNPRLSAVVEYVNKTWLNEYRTRFVSLWTKNILHFGQRTTNRVESAHSQLKNWLGTATGSFHVIFEKIDTLVNLQLDEIKGKMEKSRTSSGHITSFLLFSRLKFKVSHHAIDLIKEEYDKRFEKIGRNVENCGCEMRNSFGLPCAHELNENVAKKVPIDLFDIHEFWKTLDIEPRESREQQSQRQTALQWFEELCSEVRNGSEAKINYYASGLYEMLYPESTKLEEPIQKSHRGRPKNKSSSSTKREPSAWETSEKKASKEQKSEQDIRGVFTEKSDYKYTVASKSQGKRSTKTSKPYKFPHPTIVPKFMLPYIENDIDVEPDGNCGFRVVATFVYGSQDRWKDVMMDLTEEMIVHKELYKTRCALGCEEYYTQMLETLSYYGEGVAPERHWYSAAELGPIVATRYQRIFTYWDPHLVVTFLPFEIRHVEEPSTRHISMAHIRGNHFIALCMADDYPLPPVAQFWERNCHEDARQFVHDIKSRLDKFSELQHSH